jgi:hypothetical protein
MTATEMGSTTPNREWRMRDGYQQVQGRFRRHCDHQPLALGATPCGPPSPVLPQPPASRPRAGARRTTSASTQKRSDVSGAGDTARPSPPPRAPNSTTVYPLPGARSRDRGVRQRWPLAGPIMPGPRGNSSLSSIRRSFTVENGAFPRCMGLGLTRIEGRASPCVATHTSRIAGDLR